MLISVQPINADPFFPTNPEEEAAGRHDAD